MYCRRKPSVGSCVDASSNSWRSMQGFNGRPCFFVRDEELRAACKAGAGTRCGTRGPNRDSVRHHVSRSGFGCTCAILCRSSMPGPGASLGILASMRDSMCDLASSYVLRDSVRASLQDPGPVAPTEIHYGTKSPDRQMGGTFGIQCGIRELTRSYS